MSFIDSLNLLFFKMVYCTFYMLYRRAVPIPGIFIGIRPITAFFGGIGIGQVCYTSTNSVVCAIYYP